MQDWNERNRRKAKRYIAKKWLTERKEMTATHCTQIVTASITQQRPYWELWKLVTQPLVTAPLMIKALPVCAQNTHLSSVRETSNHA